MTFSFINKIISSIFKNNRNKNIINIIVDELNIHKKSFATHVRYKCDSYMYVDGERIKVCLNILSRINYKLAEKVLTDVKAIDVDNVCFNNYVLCKKDI